MGREFERTDDEWREQLSPTQYAVCRRKATEPAFTGAFWDLHAHGSYRCVCCNAELFRSEDKFDSGTGWPSFAAPAADRRIDHADDLSHGMHRMEALCARCGAHLGHIFPDGPPPSGLRYCINSAALAFDPKPSASRSGTGA